MQKYILNVSRGEYWEEHKERGETGDCVIRAITHASMGKLTYSQVYDEFTKAGRTFCGPSFARQYMVIMRKLGFLFIGTHGNSESAQEEKQMAKIIGLSHRVMKGTSFGTAIANMRKGGYCVSFNNHMVAVVNGGLIDGGPCSASRHVSGVWKFVG